MNYEDLMARINKSYSEAKHSIGDQNDPRIERRNADRRRGLERFEFSVTIEAITSFFGRIFKGKK